MTLAEHIERELAEIRKRIDQLWLEVMQMMEQQDVKVERVH